MNIHEEYFNSMFQDVSKDEQHINKTIYPITISSKNSEFRICDRDRDRDRDVILT